MSAFQFSPAYSPNHAQDTLSTVQKQAQKNGYCDVDGHHDIKIRINLGFGQKKQYQECHRCAKLYELELKKRQLELDNAIGSDKEQLKKALADFERVHKLYEQEKQRRIELELKLEEANEREQHAKQALATEKENHEAKTANAFREGLNALNSVSNMLQIQIKMLLIGDSGVGKSQLNERFVEKRFSDIRGHIPTIGIDYRFKYVHTDEHSLKLTIWDTAGQERFRTVTTTYFRGTHVVMICVDVTDERTLQSFKGWIDQLKIHGCEEIPIVVAGNKCDLSEHRQWSTSQMERVLEEYPAIRYFEVSAKTGQGVDEMFLCAAKLALGNINVDSYKGVVSLDTSARSPPTQRKPGCCS